MMAQASQIGEPGAEDKDAWPWLGDGLAQWIMAGLGIPAVALSWYAVVLLKRTLVATRDAVKQAEAGAIAAPRDCACARD